MENQKQGQFNELIIASVNEFSQGKVDKNGKQTLILNIVAGKFPGKRNVLNGTIAENMGVEVGKTYLMQVRETPISKEYGRQFNYNKLQEISAMDLIDATIKLGNAVSIDVTGETVAKKSAQEVFQGTESGFENQG